MDILYKLNKALDKDKNITLEEMAKYFNLEMNEKLGDGIINTIKKKMKEIQDDCKYICNMAIKVAKNTGDKERKKKVEKEANDVMKELSDLEKTTHEMLNYMFGDDEL